MWTRHLRIWRWKHWAHPRYIFQQIYLVAFMAVLALNKCPILNPLGKVTVWFFFWIYIHDNAVNQCSVICEVWCITHWGDLVYCQHFAICLHWVHCCPFRYRLRVKQTKPLPRRTVPSKYWPYSKLPLDFLFVCIILTPLCRRYRLYKDRQKLARCPTLMTYSWGSFTCIITQTW